MSPKKRKITKYKSQIEVVVKQWHIEGTSSYDQKLIEVDKWLQNFKPSEIEYAIDILEHIQYKSPDDIKEYVQKLAKQLNAIFQKAIDEVLFFPLGTSSADSGSQFLYKYRTELGLSEKNFPESNFKPYLNSTKPIVFIDDIIASGNQATKFFEEHLKDAKADCYYITIFALEKGLEGIRGEAKFKAVFAAEELSEEDMAFTSTSMVFEDFDDTRIKAIKDLAYKYGQIHYPKHPLGYNDTQALIILPDNVPNNTLPIIWAGPESESEKSEVFSPLWKRMKKVNPKIENNIESIRTSRKVSIHNNKKDKKNMQNHSYIKELIKKDKIADSIEALLKINGLGENEDRLIRLRAKLSALETANIFVEVSRENYLIEKDKIRTGILTIYKNLNI